MSAASSWLRNLVFDARLRRRALVFLAVLALSFVPMAGTLGYYSSLLLAPPMSLLAAVIGVQGVRAIRSRVPAAQEGTEALWRLAGDGLRELAWLLGSALAPLLLGMLWNQNCDPIGGFAYFVMGPVCAAVIGWTAGVGMTVLTLSIGGDRPRWQQLSAAFLPFLVSTAIGVHRLYFEPVVFAYDPFWGWFSGPIYDEGMAIGRRFVLYRAYNFTAVAAVWLILQAGADPSLRLSIRRMISDGPRRARSSVALLLIAVSVTIGATAPRWGFTATSESLAEVLSGARETEHFVIHYVPGSITAREIEVVAAEHEFAWARLERRLGRTPDRKVESFIFVSGTQRGALIGADKVEVSPPWRRQMYLSHRPWPHDVMHHELAHAFLADFGDRLLGLPIARFRFSGALVEGVPTALTPRAHDNLGLHEQAAILDRLDKRPPLSQIMGAGFWGAAASRAYTAAGSFVLWLAETRGWPEVAELYGNAGDFRSTYGTSLAELEREWLEFLRAIPLREQDVEAQAQRFEQGSVFRRPCAHRAAELLRASIRAQRHGKRDEALELQRQLCRIEPEDPSHVLRLASTHASFGEFEAAAKLLDELATRRALTSTTTAVIAEQRGDTALLAGRLADAASFYAAAMELGQSETRRRQLQIKLIGAQDPAIAPAIAAYFDPFGRDGGSEAEAILKVWTATKIAQTPGHQAIGNYLLGRQFSAIAAPEQAAEALALALAPGTGEPPLPGPEIERAALIAMISALTQTGAWDRARMLLDRVEALAEGEGHRQEVAEWRERIDFFQAWFTN
jgi:tetratricopeptide (TPR) repeat protein